MYRSSSIWKCKVALTTGKQEDIVGVDERTCGKREPDRCSGIQRISCQIDRTLLFAHKLNPFGIIGTGWIGQNFTDENARG